MHAAARRGAASDGQSPYEVLGLQPGCTASDVRPAPSLETPHLGGGRCLATTPHSGKGGPTAETACWLCVWYVPGESSIQGQGQGACHTTAYTTRCCCCYQSMSLLLLSLGKGAYTYRTDQDSERRERVLGWG